MAETSAIDRIARATARIEAAAQARATASQGLEQRHAELKRRIADAVATLDDLIARGGND